MKLPKSGKYTRSSIYLIPNGKSKGRYQARFHFYNEDKRRWDYHTQLIPVDVVKKAEKTKSPNKALERWAKQRLDERNEKIVESLLPDPDKKNDTRTVDEMVENYLKYQLSSNLISLRAFEDQSAHYEKHISPFIGEIGFLSLTRFDIQEMLTELNNSGLKQSTIYHYVKIVRKVYNYYCPLENISNPFAGIVLFRGKPRKSHLTQEQTKELLEKVKEEFEEYSPMQVGIYLAFYCGLRRGEICGLRWRNIDFDSGWIVIDTTIGASKGKQFTKQPKNDRIRSFPLNPSLLKYLKEMNEAKNPDGNSFVLTCTNKWYSVHVFTKNFTDFRKKYKLTDFYNHALSPHGIRHNLATVGIRSGMDMASLSNMMGHSSISLTVDVYGDTSQMGKVIGAKQLAEQFEKEAKSRKDKED